MSDERTYAELLENSSVGTPAAKALRARGRRTDGASDDDEALDALVDEDLADTFQID